MVLSIFEENNSLFLMKTLHFLQKRDFNFSFKDPKSQVPFHSFPPQNFWLGPVKLGTQAEALRTVKFWGLKVSKKVQVSYAPEWAIQVHDNWITDSSLRRLIVSTQRLIEVENPQIWKFSDFENCVSPSESKGRPVKLLLVCL